MIFEQQTQNRSFKNRKEDISFAKKGNFLVWTLSILLLVLVISSVIVFGYFTEKSNLVNEINAKLKSTENEIIKLKSQIQVAESLEMIEQRAAKLGLTQDQSVKVINPGSQTVGLRNGSTPE